MNDDLELSEIKTSAKIRLRIRSYSKLSLPTLRSIDAALWAEARAARKAAKQKIRDQVFNRE